MAIDERDRPDPADLAALGITEAEFMAEYEAATARGKQETPDETRITAARYDSTTDRIMIELANGITLLVPPASVQALAGAKHEDLAVIELLGTHMLDWPRMDQQVYIPDLLRGITGTRAWMARQLGSKGGKKGGSAKTSVKAAAARANGAKGGRPRKNTAP
jgi:hypothetical protein